jgi:hypothetical protein
MIFAFNDTKALRYVGSLKNSASVDRESVGNLQSASVTYSKHRDWFDECQSKGRKYMRRAIETENSEKRIYYEQFRSNTRSAR